MPNARVVTSGPLPILCYHKVGPVEHLGRRLNIEPVRFESHVRFFARRGYRAVLARDLAPQLPWPDRAICYTFDDGFEATLANAVPLLEKYGARGSFYVVTGRVGGLSTWEGGEDLPLAGWGILRSAQASGHEIGNHTATHPFLASLSSSDSLFEITSAQKRLMAEGLNSRSFCYPYGSLPANPASALGDAGLAVGLSLTKGVARTSDPRFLLPRVTVAYSHALPMLLYRLFVRFKK